jgi:small neutral amino acid transporter SnatA (MarC family)
MSPKFARFIAVMLLVIPGWLATYGFLLMKNSVFDSFGPAPFPWLKFFAGLLLFAFGVGFIGGWIFYRDRKRNYVAPRFKEKKKELPRK